MSNNGNKCGEYASKNQLDYLVGLKGICAIIVVFFHFSMAFFPTIVDANATFQSLNIEPIISNSPLFVLLNGQFVVYIFWCVSGFLISYSWYLNHSINMMKIKAIKKYLSFLAPAGISIFISYLIMKLGLYYNAEAATITGSTWLSGFYNFQPNLFLVLKQTLYDCFFTGDTTYNIPLWTMTFEITGSLMTILILVLFGDMKKRYFVYIFFVVVTRLIEPKHMIFIFGIICADFIINNRIKVKKCITATTLIIGILGGGFPALHEASGIYSFFPYKNPVVIYCVSAAFILWAVINNETIQKILSSKCFVYLGKKSIYIYIFHFPILCSVCSFVFIKLYEMQGNYVLSAIIAILISCGCILITVNMFCYFFEKTWKKIVSKMVEWIIGDTKDKTILE